MLARFYPSFLRRFSETSVSLLPSWIWIVGLWVLMAIPAITLRGTHFEEGTVLALAHGAVADGNWLAPDRYGVRFVERPVLLSWMIAAVSSVTGGVSVVVARSIHLIFLLAGAGLIFRLVERHAGKAAGLFGVMCWFACPMVAQKFITVEPDVTMSVLLFAAFKVWWDGEEARRVTPLRWIAVGVFLIAAAMTKGPQPLGYFILGVGAYLVLKQRWVQLPGFAAANLLAIGACALWYWQVAQPGDAKGWMAHSRLEYQMTPMQWMRDHLDFLISLAVEWLPGSILLAPVIARLIRKPANPDSDLLLAVTLYALGCSLALLVWPGGVATRYAMPANLAIAVMAGLMFEAWRLERPRLIGSCLAIVCAIAVYVVALGWIAMPLFPAAFNKTRIAAQTIQAVYDAVPRPLYVSNASVNYNTLAYLRSPVRVVPINDMRNLTTPFLAVLTLDEIAEFASISPNAQIVHHDVIHDSKTSEVVEITNPH